MAIWIFNYIKKIKEEFLLIPVINLIYHSLKKDKVVDIFNPHLGGYRPGGDYATEVKPLWEYFYKILGCRTVLDVGCAEGWAIKAMLEIGFDAYGIEGLSKILFKSPCPDRIIIHDLTKNLICQIRDLTLCGAVKLLSTSKKPL